MENLMLARNLLASRVTDEEWLKQALRETPEPFYWPTVLNWMILMAERQIYAGPGGKPWCMNWHFEWDDVRAMVPWKAAAKINKTLIEWS